MSIEPVENEPAGRRLVPFRGRETQDQDAAQNPATDQPADDTPADRSRFVGFLGTVVGVSLAAVIVAPVTLSATHLIGWASSAAGLGLPIALAWLVFVALDLAAVTCIGMVVLCAMRGEGAGSFSLATWGFAFASAFANFSGGHGAGKWFFPAMSLAGPALLEMVLAKVKGWARISEGTQLSARPRFGVRWMPGIAFTETRRAWAVARRENIAKATDAIAMVREIDILAEMTDADAVRYAKAAARTSDPYELRQWLTSRGKNVAQAALPAVALPVQEIFAPMPEPVSAPREVRSLPVAAEPSVLPEPKPRPRPRPRPVKDKDEKPVEIRRQRQQDHPRWADAETVYRESIQKGAKLSQRKLSETLGIHRNLARAVIAHVDDELFPEG